MARRMFVMIYENQRVKDSEVVAAIEKEFGPRYFKDSTSHFVVYFVRRAKL